MMQKDTIGIAKILLTHVEGNGAFQFAASSEAKAPPIGYGQSNPLRVIISGLVCSMLVLSSACNCAFESEESCIV